MKKSIVALATLSAIGTALADVDVSGGIKLYGVLDQAYTSQTLTAPISNGSTVQYNSLFASSATSRLGVKGNRDLGEGIKGRVQAEIQIEPDNKSLLPADKNRTGFVGISKEGAGEVLLGTQETTAYEIFGMDVNGRVEYKPQVWRTTTSSNLQDRANNAVKYISPEFKGFSLHLTKGFSDTTVSTSNVFTSVGLKLNIHKFKAAYVYDKLTNSTASYGFAGIINAGPSNEGYKSGTANATVPANIPTNQSATALVYGGSATGAVYRQIGSATYDFGAFSANYLFAKSYTTGIYTGSNTTNTFGVKIPFEKMTFAASYGTGVVDSYTTYGTGFSGDGRVNDTTVGFYYSIDKSTNVYTLYSQSGYTGGYKEGSNKTTAFGARYNF